MQTHILHNDISDLLFFSDTYQILDCFSWFSGKKTVQLKENSSTSYVAIFQNADVDIDFALVGEDSSIDVFCVFLGNISSQIITSLSANKAVANVHIFCVALENADMSIYGNIVVWKDISHVEWHLYQEQLLFWTPKKLSLRPVLDVYSNQVKASHGAKIYTLDKEKMFYMMSKWLSQEQAQLTVVDSTFQYFFDKIPDIDNDQKMKIKKALLSSIFTL